MREAWHEVLKVNASMSFHSLIHFILLWFVKVAQVF